jgi:hypothetical protein
MIRAAAVAVVLSAAASPALATEWVSCSSADGEASIEILVGQVDILAVAGIRLSANGKSWVSATAYGEGTIVSFGQGYADRQMVLVDVMDEAVSDKVAELRLFIADEGEDFVFGGTLRVVGEGAWPVSCVGP